MKKSRGGWQGAAHSNCSILAIFLAGHEYSSINQLISGDCRHGISDAKMWQPDDVVFVDKLQYSETEKINKLELREQFKDYEFPGA